MLQATFQAQIDITTLALPVWDIRTLKIIFDASPAASFMLIATASPFGVVTGDCPYHLALAFVVDLKAITAFEDLCSDECTGTTQVILI